MKTGIAYSKDGVIWVSFRGKGQYLPCVHKLRLFENLDELYQALLDIAQDMSDNSIRPEISLEGVVSYRNLLDIAIEGWKLIRVQMSRGRGRFEEKTAWHNRYESQFIRVFIHTPNGKFAPTPKH